MVSAIARGRGIVRASLGAFGEYAEGGFGESVGKGGKTACVSIDSEQRSVAIRVRPRVPASRQSEPKSSATARLRSILMEGLLAPRSK